jgi:uncharacterized protein YpmS
VRNDERINWWKAGLLALVATVGLVVVLVALWGGVKAFSRYQHRADASNAARVTVTRAAQARNQIAVIQAEADQRYAESVGIRRAQDEVAKTLTALYIQHEAIQAQLKMAGSPNHTVVWAPAGANGVPLVSTIDLQRLAEPPNSG